MSIAQPKRPGLAAHLFPEKDFEHKEPDFQPAENAQPDKLSLCIETLVSGHVNSFVDFFFLTHRSEDENVNASRPSIPDDQLKFICRLEVARKICASK